MTDAHPARRATGVLGDPYGPRSRLLMYASGAAVLVACAVAAVQFGHWRWWLFSWGVVIGLVSATIAGPNGNILAAAYLRFRLVDLVVHAWDILRAARLDETLDPLIVVGVMDLVEPHLADMLAFGAYGAGPSGTLAPDASPQSRLLDWFERRP
jgi:MFS family permease